LHNNNIVRLHTDGSMLTATLVDGGLVEQRFADVKLGEDVLANLDAFWLSAVEMAARGGE
jgi:hypothetical protein